MVLALSTSVERTPRRGNRFFGEGKLGAQGRPRGEQGAVSLVVDVAKLTLFGYWAMYHCGEKLAKLNLIHFELVFCQLMANPVPKIIN